MIVVEKKKLYKGMVELRDEQIRKFEGQSVKLIYNGEFMILTPAQLKKGIFINQQRSIINHNQSYSIYGWRWKPTGRLDEQVDIFQAMSKMAGTKSWEELREKLHK